MALFDKQQIMEEIVNEGREGYSRFLAEKMKDEVASTDTAAPSFSEEKAQKIDAKEAARVVNVEHKDTNELREIYSKFMEMVDGYNKIKEERASHQEKLDELENQPATFGAPILTEQRISREKATLKAELAELKDKQQEIMLAFKNITVPEIRKSIYKYLEENLHDPYDAFGLSDKILVERTRERKGNPASLNADSTAVEIESPMIKNIETTPQGNAEVKADEAAANEEVKSIYQAPTETATEANPSTLANVAQDIQKEAEPEPEQNNAVAQTTEAQKTEAYKYDGKGLNSIVFGPNGEPVPGSLQNQNFQLEQMPNSAGEKAAKINDLVAHPPESNATETGEIEAKKAEINDIEVVDGNATTNQFDAIQAKKAGIARGMGLTLKKPEPLYKAGNQAIEQAVNPTAAAPTPVSNEVSEPAQNIEMPAAPTVDNFAETTPAAPATQTEAQPSTATPGVEVMPVEPAPSLTEALPQNTASEVEVKAEVPAVEPPQPVAPAPEVVRQAQEQVQAAPIQEKPDKATIWKRLGSEVKRFARGNKDFDTIEWGNLNKMVVDAREVEKN